MAGRRPCADGAAPRMPCRPPGFRLTARRTEKESLPASARHCRRPPAHADLFLARHCEVPCRQGPVAARGGDDEVPSSAQHNLRSRSQAHPPALSPKASTNTATWSPAASMVSGVSPLELATPALLNRITGRPCARPSVTQRIPIVHIAAEMLKKDKWRSALRAEPPVCVPHPLRLNETGRSCVVGFLWHIDLHV